MNEINIYAKYNYKKARKKANIYFNKKYNRLNMKTIFAPKAGTYSVSLRKNNIRICYWEENTKNGKKNIDLIKRFVEEIFHNNVIGFTFDGETNILNNLNSIKKIRLQ